MDDLARTLQSETAGRIALAGSRVDGLKSRLRALDPAATLARGFSVVQKVESGQVVASVSQVVPGDSLAITVADGVVPAVAGGPTAAKAKPVPKKRKASVAEPGMERLL